jgi:hypothetical protein
VLWEYDRVRAWALGAAKLGYQVVQRAMQLAPSELHFSIPLSYPYCPFSGSDIKTSGIA